ncbi:PRC-barrel domain-containing protein [Desulfocurvibacter africanus]|uniref:PRC-barrel domain protein n=1 Tax=Desulfocurvibacter africanus subsp. africanus str. Walvis Bay TaxID=690850 RepID=F3YV25_DESAF|nr:PRC-barrel domain-containing protein [Desulfocurvibacter africanus]EGJ49275.1 PRC-barrel domain protein [Desulfocurvibacter africanus subsp. africanus str. Walvis Bay]
MLRIVQAVAVLLVFSILASLTAATAAQRETSAEGRAVPRAVVDAYFSERLLEADRILNRAILDSQGEAVGEIFDVLVDPETGRLAYAIIERGGELEGVRVLAPYESLHYSYLDREFVLATYAGFAVGMAPVYVGSRGGVLTREEFSERYTKRLAQARRESQLAQRIQPAGPEREAAAGDEEQPAGQDEQGQAERGQADRSQAEQGGAGQERAINEAADEQGEPGFNQGLVELERLRNRPLKDRDGKNVGEIDSILVDPAQGSLRIVVVETGGFLGLGKDLVAVPWERLRFDWESRELALNMSKQELDRAPQVDPARRQVIFRDTPSGYEQFIYLEQRARQVRKSEER